MKIKLIFVISLLMLSPFVVAKDEIRATALDLFDTFKQRKDFERFLTFYDKNVKFEDVFHKVKLTNKAQFLDFYDWQKGDFDRLSNQFILQLDTLVIDGNSAVAQGTFLPFKFNGEKMGPWDFVIWLEFNEQGKVISQRDWINYSQNEAQ